MVKLVDKLKGGMSVDKNLYQDCMHIQRHEYSILDYRVMLSSVREIIFQNSMNECVFGYIMPHRHTIASLTTCCHFFHCIQFTLTFNIPVRMAELYLLQRLCFSSNPHCFAGVQHRDGLILGLPIY